MYLERAFQKVANVVTVYLKTSTPTWWIQFRKFLKEGRAVSQSSHYSAVPKFAVKAYDLLAGAIVQKYSKFLEVRSPPHVDMIFVVEPVRRRFDFRKFDAPTAYYAIDNHLAFKQHIRDVRVQDYDFVFVAQKDYIPKYQEAGCEKVYWLPLACDPEIHKKWNLPMTYDVAFVGNIAPGSERDRLLRELARKYNVNVSSRFLHDMAKVYSRSKIVFNKSVAGDLNMRVFEAMSCGRLLLTDRIANGLEELFVDKKHLVIYDDLADLIEKVEYYLRNADERERIATQGQKEVHQKHTYLHRAKFVLKTVLKNQVQGLNSICGVSQRHGM
jgi:spore maturation protein CgeB